MRPDYDLDRLSITVVCLVAAVMFAAIGVETVGLYPNAIDSAKAVIGGIVVTCTVLLIAVDVLGGTESGESY